MVKVFSPAHITGIFAVEEGGSPLLKGSRGVGVTLSHGVHTWVEAEPASAWKVEVKSVGANVGGEVSRRVVELLKGKAHHSYHVRITHEFQVPVGAGYGASGAGALGVALGLNEALKLGLSQVEAANVAHVAEVECGTGLGTVLAETWGGLAFRVKAGAPSIGRVVKLPADGLWVVSACWGPLSTRSLLASRRFKRRVKQAGSRLLKEFSRRPGWRSFLKLSGMFSRVLGLQSLRVRRAAEALAAEGYPYVGVNMLGEAVFTLVEEGELPDFQRLAMKLPALKGCRLVFSKVSMDGVRVEA